MEEFFCTNCGKKLDYVPIDNRNECEYGAVEFRQEQFCSEKCYDENLMKIDNIFSYNNNDIHITL